GQIGWLFPVALIGGIAAWRLARAPGERRDLLLWGGWAVSYGTVFSAAGGLFHAYYLALLAPALSALVGVGAAALWSLYRRGGGGALVLPVAVVATAIWQAYILDGYRGHLAVGDGWLGPLIAAAGAALAIPLVGLHRRSRRAARRLAVAGAVLVL